MHVCIIDAVRAYLYQTYPSALPGDFYQNACESLLQYTVPADVVYRIEKYIYCLPDSGRAYYQAYSRLLVDSGYIKSKSDPCLFLNVYPDSEDRIYIWVHVDDTFSAATSTWLLDEFEAVVKSRFKITVKSDTDLCIGITPQRKGSSRVTMTTTAHITSKITYSLIIL